VTLPLLGTPSVTAFAGVVASRTVQRLVVVTHTLLKVPAPATIVTDPLHGSIDTTPAVVESAALPHAFIVGLSSITDGLPPPVSFTICDGDPSIDPSSVPTTEALPPLSSHIAGAAVAVLTCPPKTSTLLIPEP
jgi:hypothetical protein